MDSAFWLNLGIAGAVVFVVKLFLGHLKQEREACNRCRSEHNQVTREFGKIVANHMLHEIEAREKLVKAIHSLRTLIEEDMKSETSRKGGKDVR